MSEYVMPNGQSFDDPIPSDNNISEYELKRKIKRSYNWAGGVMLLQLVFALAVQFAIQIPYQVKLTMEYISEHGSITDIEAFNAWIMPFFEDGLYLIAVNTVVYLVANLLCFFIGRKVSKNLFPAKMFSKGKLSGKDCGLCIAAVVGLQGVSMLIQFAMMTITKTSAMNETMAAMASFSDDILKNVIMVFYFVVVAAVTEELLCRGVMMKFLSPVNKSFALIASALMFGLMHGNFAQIFNGALLGLVLGYAAMKSGSLKLSIACHMAANTNAMLLAAIEHFLPEQAGMIELIYAVVLAVLAVVSIITLLKRNGWVNNNDGYEEEEKLEIAPEKTKALTWKLLLKSWTFWVFTVVYLITAIMLLTPVTEMMQ